MRSAWIMAGDAESEPVTVVELGLGIFPKRRGAGVFYSEMGSESKPGFFFSKCGFRGTRALQTFPHDKDLEPEPQPPEPSLSDHFPGGGLPPGSPKYVHCMEIERIEFHSFQAAQ